MEELQDATVTLDYLDEHVVSPLLIILKMCCYRSRLVFNCCFYDIDISQGSVVTRLRCGGISSDSIITNVLLIQRVK